MKERKIDGCRVAQIRLPDPADTDEHPRLLFNGWGIHAGECFKAWVPGEGFVEISLEMAWNVEGAACWYISTEGYRDICPVGLWCIID